MKFFHFYFYSVLCWLCESATVPVLTAKCEAEPARCDSWQRDEASCWDHGLETVKQAAGVCCGSSSADCVGAQSDIWIRIFVSSDVPHKFCCLQWNLHSVKYSGISGSAADRDTLDFKSDNPCEHKVAKPRVSYGLHPLLCFIKCVLPVFIHIFNLAHKTTWMDTMEIPEKSLNICQKVFPVMM